MLFSTDLREREREREKQKKSRRFAGGMRGRINKVPHQANKVQSPKEFVDYFYILIFIFFFILII